MFVFLTFNKAYKVVVNRKKTVIKLQELKQNMLSEKGESSIRAIE
jgi:hypothetical protein